MSDPGDAAHRPHPLDERLRVIEGYLGYLLDELGAVERRQHKVEEEMLALTAQQCETASAIQGIAGSIRDMLSVRLRRDEERDEDRAIVRRLIWWAVALAVGTVLIHMALASRWAIGPITFDPRGLWPEAHSSQLPPHVGGKAP